MIKNKPKILGCVGIFIILAWISSCKKVLDSSNDDWKNINCDNLRTGIMTTDSQIVKLEVDKLLIDLQPSVTSEDALGHRQNINTFINRLITQCDGLDAELLCYACILTNPPQSEIRVTIDSAGTQIGRTIDILTPEDLKLNCMNIHR